MAILVFTQIRKRCGLHITKSAEGDKGVFQMITVDDGGWFLNT